MLQNFIYDLNENTSIYLQRSAYIEKFSELIWIA